MRPGVPEEVLLVRQGVPGGRLPGLGGGLLPQDVSGAVGVQRVPGAAPLPAVFSQASLSEKSAPFFRVSSRKFFGSRRGHAPSFLTCRA